MKSSSHLKTSNGNEVDLVLERGEQSVFIEFKLQPAPRAGKGFRLLIDECRPSACWYVTPADSAYPLDDRIQVGSPLDAVRAIHAL